MKRQFFLITLLLLVSLIGALLPSTAALAANYYIHRTFNRGGTFDTSGFNVTGTFSYSVPPGDIYVHSITSMNSVVFDDSTWVSGLSGSGSGPFTMFAPAFYPFPQPTPYT